MFSFLLKVEMQHIHSAWSRGMCLLCCCLLGSIPAWRLKLLLASGKVNPANPICVRPRLILVTFLIIVPAGHQSHVTTEAQQGFFFFWWTIWHFFNNWSEKAKLSHLSALVALFDSLPSSIWDGTAAVLGPSEESVCRCGKAIIRSTFT